MVNKSLACLLCAIVISCAYKTPRKQLKEFIDDPKNRMEQSICVGDVKLVAKWLPPQFQNIDSISIKRNGKSVKESFYYFRVRFEMAKASSLAKEQEQYLKYELQKDFHVLCAGDTIQALFSHKLGSASRYEYVVVFASTGKNLYKNAFTFCYTDKVFNLGDVAFAYRKEDLAKIPYGSR